MTLHKPFMISSRLMPAIRIGAATVSLAHGGRYSRDGRDIYEVWIDFDDGREYEITDLRSGCQGGTVAEGFASLFGFLSAAAESRRYRDGDEIDEDSHETLFEAPIVDWAVANDDEISMLSVELEEDPTQFIEEED